jgi:hypothetical protein
VNRRKSDHLKIFTGTFRPCRAAPEHVELPLVEAVPPPPPWLTDPLAVDEWMRLARILVANRLLSECALGPLAILCALHAAIAQATSAGATPKASLIAQYRALAGDFALTLAGQQRLKPPAPTAANRVNPFAAFEGDKV